MEVGDTIYRDVRSLCEPLVVTRIGTQWISYVDSGGVKGREQEKFVGRDLFQSVDAAIEHERKRLKLWGEELVKLAARQADSVAFVEAFAECYASRGNLLHYHYDTLCLILDVGAGQECIDNGGVEEKHLTQLGKICLRRLLHNKLVDMVRPAASFPSRAWRWLVTDDGRRWMEAWEQEHSVASLLPQRRQGYEEH